MTTPGASAPDGAFVLGGSDGNVPSYGQGLTQDSVNALMKGGVVSSFSNAQDVAHVTYNNVIDDHTQSITTIEATLTQLVLQGVAIVFSGNGSYTPTAGIKSIEIILLGAGAGGSSGSYDALLYGFMAGGGGGGGAEIHTLIPASALPVDTDGNFLPIAIVVGAGGAGATSDQGVGTGGGDTVFGNTGNTITAGGGQGGVWGHPPNASSGAGGAGMIPGGHGGYGSWYVSGTQNQPPTVGGDSASGFSLNGGGGGGGGGGCNAFAGTAGGSGVTAEARGGAPGNPASVGGTPSSLTAIGGGGGGGGLSTGAGANGAVPAGGGGGGACDTSGGKPGGNGGAGRVYIIEHTT